MIKVEFTRKALDICKAHWGEPKTRCAKCPIHSACTAQLRSFTWEGVNEHTTNVNIAAEAVKDFAS